ncbi:MAG: NAD(+)/NADH kinase [Nitrospirae bacterium]|nr:NAD(+)/NADH kinase [Nitrospirota bacterium]MDA1303328.1 NAD(+)/NADH kinase [Nitrospirota bacterium]
MNTIGILTKPQFPELETVLKELVHWLQSKQKKIVLGSSAAELLQENHSHGDQALAAQSELVIVLGGDGSMLSAARLVEPQCTPILGVNMGGLGFLTEVTVDHMYDSLEKVFDTQFQLDNRLRLQAKIFHTDGNGEQGTALNDIVISKGTLGRMIKTHIQVDKQFVTHLRGDGVIVASPTGSTAYSMSAGGPILEPSLETLLLTPISPHTLTHRPLLVPSQVSLEITLTSDDEVRAVFDGQIGFTMNQGDSIVISASPHRTRLIRFPDRTYYDVLRNKLKWGNEEPAPHT